MLVCYFYHLYSDGPSSSSSSCNVASVRLKGGGDRFLLRVSRFLGDEVICRGLALLLLKAHPGGGETFIDTHISPGAHVDWRVMAHKVLEEWCMTVPASATSVSLHQACVQLKAYAAARFVAEHFHQAPTKPEVKLLPSGKMVVKLFFFSYHCFLYNFKQAGVDRSHFFFSGRFRFEHT